MTEDERTARIQQLIKHMRECAKRWDYDQHDERDVLMWVDELEALFPFPRTAEDEHGGSN